ncbi:cytochrome C oxidase subunit IV family protein [Ruegeria atlantica]|uniref:cytochrome C oxidase subunit IV family protein n=1 Tax=Ruegeria atlantica TaxID=81569 RepID=UPI0032B4FA83
MDHAVSRDLPSGIGTVSQASSFFKCARWRLPNSLLRAWLTLLALSLVSALLTMLPILPELLSAGILILALIKARVILALYLDLAKSQVWLRGFTAVLTGFVLVIFSLYLM